MQHQAYPFVLNEQETHYKFESIGKRGIFEKAVAFSELRPNVYNLVITLLNLMGLSKVF
ncbi:DUF6934 family protein [Dyadobacter fanqingshengii]|uniref:DUF6934 family protein n=1 Tax=Dyadobacter fanqingshengii TaxID=2906443 RepID=UPI0035B68B40